MTTLAQISLQVGGVLTALSVPALLATERWQASLRAFPRSVAAGWLLSAVDLVWVGWIMYNGQLAWFNPYKIWLSIIAPAAIVILNLFMEELLAARALGGLLLLLAHPMLNAARWHEAESALLVKLLAYAFVVAGMFLVLAPYEFRRYFAWWMTSPGRFRAGSAALLLLGLALVGLSVTVY